MEYTSKEQSEKLKEVGVDPMTSDIYVTENGEIRTSLGRYICPRCFGELIWQSDFMRSEVEGVDDIELDDDSLVTYYQCKDCHCIVDVVDAWPNEAGEGALVRLAWTTDALIKLITDRDFDFFLSRSNYTKQGQWSIEVFYTSGVTGGTFKKYGDSIIDVLFKAVVELYEKGYSKIENSNKS